MMTRSEIERLTAVEEQVASVKESVERIEHKLDEAIVCKADKSEVKAVSDALAEKASAQDFTEMRRVLVSVLLSVAGFAIVTLVGIVLLSLNLK